MASEFLNELYLRVVDDTSHERRAYAIASDFTFRSEILGKDYTVRRGFIFDGASIPRLGLPITGQIADRAAAIHDSLVRGGEVERAIADLIFHEALLASRGPNGERIDPAIARLMYLAVAGATAGLTRAPVIDEGSYVA